MCRSGVVLGYKRTPEPSERVVMITVENILVEVLVTILFVKSFLSRGGRPRIWTSGWGET
jgi:hypothetical protein